MSRPRKVYPEYVTCQRCQMTYASFLRRPGDKCLDQSAFLNQPYSMTFEEWLATNPKALVKLKNQWFEECVPRCHGTVQ